MAEALAIGDLTAKVEDAFRQEGCADMEFEVIALSRALADGRNWEIVFPGSLPAPQHVERYRVFVHIRLGRRFRLMADA